MEQSTPDALLRFVGDKTENEIGSANSILSCPKETFLIKVRPFQNSVVRCRQKKENEIDSLSSVSDFEGKWKTQ